jgi:2-methylcitrate dehydratase PrpD
MAGLTEQIAAFVANPGWSSVNPEALGIIRSGFIDTAATMLAGRDEPVTELLRAHVRAKRAGSSEASLLLGEERASTTDAALVNGAAGHALDYDDVALSGHPSTVLVPGVLAAGEALGASGLDVLRAYLVGYEVWAELIGRDADLYHTKGWHPTGVFGTVAVAAAVANLHKLDQATARSALAIAASMSSGLTANFGTMTKPFHAGRAAANGIEAVQLAVAGMTAAADAFEHHGGFLVALSPKGRVDRERPVKLGQQLALLEHGLSIKKYPMCYATHRVIDGVLDLVQKHDVKPFDVARVEASVGMAQAGMLRNHAPVTGLEAKFSLEFAVASSIVARKVGLEELTDGFVNRPEVREAMSKLTTQPVDTRCPIEPGFAFTDRVVVSLQDGRKLDSGDIRFARGNAKLPLRLEDLRTKFMDCARGVTHLDAEALFDRLANLERVASVRELVGVRAAKRAA